MSDPVVRVIGPFVCGEKIPALQYQYLDPNNVPINLTGFTVRFAIREYNDLAATAVNASLADALNGVVSYSWTGSEIPTPGHYVCEFWAGNGTVRYASARIEFDARVAIAIPVPSI